MNDTLSPSEAWTAVAAAWEANADFVDQHSDEPTAALIHRVDVQPGERVLELAAGPGSLGPVWSRLVGQRGTVVLSDIAPGMVEVAARRNAELANVETTVIDASAIDRADGSFDVVACRMGLMFAPDPAAALAEIHRVLGSGGKFGALTWAGIEHNPWMTCIGIAAMVNGVVSGGPPVGPGGIFSLGDPNDLEGRVAAAGFENVVVEGFPVTFEADSVDAHFDTVASLAGPLATMLAGASAEQLSGVRRTAAELAAPYVTTDGVRFPGRALLVTAHR